MKEKQIKYNKWFVYMIYKHKPEWIKNIKDEYWNEYNVNYKIVEIPPSHEKAKTIYIKTHGCELTTCYDTFHSHSDQFNLIGFN
jgi:hypothetical protein